MNNKLLFSIATYGDPNTDQYHVYEYYGERDDGMTIPYLVVDATKSETMRRYGLLGELYGVAQDLEAMYGQHSAQETLHAILRRNTHLMDYLFNFDDHE